MTERLLSLVLSASFLDAGRFGGGFFWADAGAMKVEWVNGWMDGWMWMDGGWRMVDGGRWKVEGLGSSGLRIG